MCRVVVVYSCVVSRCDVSNHGVSSCGVLSSAMSSCERVALCGVELWPYRVVPC